MNGCSRKKTRASTINLTTRHQATQEQRLNTPLCTACPRTPWHPDKGRKPTFRFFSHRFILMDVLSNFAEHCHLGPLERFAQTSTSEPGSGLRHILSEHLHHWSEIPPETACLVGTLNGRVRQCTWRLACRNPIRHLEFGYCCILRSLEEGCSWETRAHIRSRALIMSQSTSFILPEPSPQTCRQLISCNGLLVNLS